jgi:hypothetical protein
MTTPSNYYLRGIVLPTGAVISQLTDLTPQTMTDMLVGYAAGHPEPLFAAIRRQRPAITFTTTNVKQILDAVAAGGNPYCCDLSAGNVDLLYVAGQPDGIRVADATASHYRIRVTKGFLTWQSISANQDGEASIACRLVAVYDGTNPPMVPAGGVALAAVPDASYWYTLGPIKLNGAQLGGEQAWTLNLGDQLDELASGGAGWSDFVSLRTTNPTVTIRALGDPWRSIGLTGTAIANLTLFLRRKSIDAGGNVANGTAQHISIAAAGGVILPESTRTGTNDPADTTLMAQLRATGPAVRALTISTAAAIA